MNILERQGQMLSLCLIPAAKFISSDYIYINFTDIILPYKINTVFQSNSIEIFSKVHEVEEHRLV